MKAYLSLYKVYENSFEDVMNEKFSVSVEFLRRTLCDLQCTHWLKLGVKIMKQKSTLITMKMYDLWENRVSIRE
jgi:hypothetical protein